MKAYKGGVEAETKGCPEQVWLWSECCHLLVAFPSRHGGAGGRSWGGIHNSRGPVRVISGATLWKGRWRGPQMAEHKSLSRAKGSDSSMLFCLAGKGTARTYGWK